MSRTVWALLALTAYALLVGVQPAFITPVNTAADGINVIAAAIPAPLWALAAGAVWLKYRQPHSKPKKHKTKHA